MQRTWVAHTSEEGCGVSWNLHEIDQHWPVGLQKKEVFAYDDSNSELWKKTVTEFVVLQEDTGGNTSVIKMYGGYLN